MTSSWSVRVQQQQKVFVASPFSEPVVLSFHTVPWPSEDPEMLWVMGPVLAVLLIIVSVIAILLLKR